MTTVLKIVGAVVLLLVILFGLAVTIVPRFLDRIYYRGEASDHFDGARFFNPGVEDDTIRPPTGGSRAGFFWRYLTGNDGRPPWPEAVAVTPSKPPARVDGERMLVTWVGHATVLVQTQGLNILTDPIWSDRTGPFGRGPRRVAAPGVRFEDLPRIDLVLVSHNHYDHMDKPTIARLWARDRPRIVTSLGNDSVIGQTGAEATAADWGGRVAVRPGVEVIVTRVQHWGSRWFTDRNRALWSGFVVRLPSGGNLFFAGDTGFGDGKWPAEAAAHGPIRLAILPIGAFRFTPGQMRIGSHMGPVEAVRAFDSTGATTALPVHWGTFRLSYEGYDTPPKMLGLLMRCTGGDPARFAGHRIGVPFDVPVAGAREPLDLSRLDACARSDEVRALP
ncbi:MBL fold metallo-hydrolase [Sphingomonas sp.]|uniref:MBL fold metallo-hydrolase n=1 Tax=Sphingomonas sp. TaxID=28214 RepID=UPI003B00949F